MSKKFPRDHSEVTSFSAESSAPLSQVIKKPKVKKQEETVITVKAEPGTEDENNEFFDRTLRVSSAVLDALSEASEGVSEPSDIPPHQHPLVEKSYPIPLKTGSCITPSDKGLAEIQFPSDFLQYLGSHPSWTFVKGDSVTSLWSYDGGVEFLVLSLDKGEGSPAVKHYIDMISRCECRSEGSVFLDLQLIPGILG